MMLCYLSFFLPYFHFDSSPLRIVCKIKLIQKEKNKHGKLNKTNRMCKTAKFAAVKRQITTITKEINPTINQSPKKITRKSEKNTTTTTII